MGGWKKKDAEEICVCIFVYEIREEKRERESEENSNTYIQAWRANQLSTSVGV
jgi:hypothetical protein